MAIPSRSFKAVLIDLSGTLHIGSTPLPNSVEALHRLRNAKIPFRICSNTSKESSSSLLSKLHGMGFDIHGNEMFTSLSACKELVLHKGLKRQVIRGLFRQHLQQYLPYLLLSDSAMEEFSNFPSVTNTVAETPYDAVVVGLAPERFTYQNLNTAFRILAHEYQPQPDLETQIPLIATHKARYFQEKDGLSMGPGGFVAALEYAVGQGTHAEVVGKPEEPFFRLVLESLKKDGVEEPDWGDVVMIGDDLEADLGGASKSLGLRRVLVKTGKYRPGDEHKGKFPPDEVHDSFATFVDSILS